MIRSIFLSALLGCSLAASALESAAAVTPPSSEEPPDVTIQPGNPPRVDVDGSLRRAQARLDRARRRLARAERDRALAAGRQSDFLEAARLRRARANRLRERAFRAQRRADAAEARMVGERRAALREVRAQRAAHSTEVLDWLGSRVSAFGLAVLLLLTAFLAAGWQPLVGWLALRRARGLEAGTYAKAIAVTAAAMAGGTAALPTLSPLSEGALSPLAVPVIAVGVMFTGLLAWSASATKVGSAGVPVGLAGRRLLPGMAVVLALVVGLGIGLIAILVGEPAEQRVAPKTAALARLAEPDPTAHPTRRVARLRAEAERADSRARRAEAHIAQSALGEFDVP